MPRWLPIMLLPILLTACAPIQRPPHEPATAWLHQARALAKAGKHREAAQRYRQAAEQLPEPERSHYLLRAAEAMYRAGDLKATQRLLAQLDPRRMPATGDRTALALLHAQLALDQDDPDTALVHLDTIAPARLQAPQLKDYHQLRARVFALQGNLIAGVRERVRLGRWLQSPQAVEANNQAILEALRLLPQDELERFQAKPFSDLAGWIDLARILRAHPYRSRDLDLALQRWRQAYPYHPAERGRFLEQHLATRRPPYRPPHKVALWLPADGPFRAAAEAVRSGMLSIRKVPGGAHPPNEGGFRVELTEYDSADVDPVTLYQRTVAQGAELIIGPLQKSKLEQLARLPRFNPPVLALNTIAEVARPGLYQFALPPEEGIAQVANSAWLHDRRRALALVPASPGGERTAGFFVPYWQQLGGQVLEVQHYDPEATDFSPSIRKLLNLDESERRFERLRRVVWEVQFEPRVRRDADFLFLQAKPLPGRLIRPQLLFYRADTLPIYATRDIYTGHPDPHADRDLEGIRFCDIPWLLEGEYENAPSIAAFEAEWGPHSGAYLRLAALGMDAYRIPFRLLGNGQRYAGVTGILTLGNGGQIDRQMTCAVFRQGIPAIYGLAPAVSTHALQ